MATSQWLAWAALSAVFAALTAIFAKVGLAGVDSDFATLLRTFVIVALLIGDLSVGAGSAGRSLGIPSQAGDLVQATVLLVTVALVAMRRWGIGPWRSRRARGAS